MARGKSETRTSGRSMPCPSSVPVSRTTLVSGSVVVVTDEPPSLKDGVGSNLCFVSARVDERTGWLVVMSSIDKRSSTTEMRGFNEKSTKLRRSWIVLL